MKTNFTKVRRDGSRGNRLIALLAFIAIFIASSAASTSAASACDLVNHCYGIASYDGLPGFVGASASMDPNCNTAPSGQFVTPEIWLSNINQSSWVEVGYIRNNASVAYLANGLQVFYWGKTPTGSTFGGTLIMNPTLVSRTFSLWKATSTSMAFSVDGTTFTESNSMFVGVAQAGSESTSALATSMTSFSGLRKRYGTWTATWTGAGVVANAPMSAVWTTTGSALWAGISC